MSRTIRRKSMVPPRYITFDWVKLNGWWQDVPKKDRELAKAIAKFHGDSGYSTHYATGDGPSAWFRRKEQMKYRSDCSRQLRKFMMDSEYEVLILPNPKWPYWD